MNKLENRQNINWKIFQGLTINKINNWDIYLYFIYIYMAMIFVHSSRTKI